MPIPDLQSNGFLPEGIYDCTIAEITNKFGQFQSCDRRSTLNKELIDYFEELKQANIGKYLIVNGSYVTSKDRPSDIDVLLILKDDIDLSDNVPPYRYNACSRKYIQNHYKLDFHFGFENDPSSIEILKYFQGVKDQPCQRKGILRLIL